MSPNQAIEMIADYPLVGVGPWRYTIVAEADYPLASGDDSPVPFWAAAGLTALNVMLGAAIVISAGVFTLRRSARA